MNKIQTITTMRRRFRASTSTGLAIMIALGTAVTTNHLVDAQQASLQQIQDQINQAEGQNAANRNAVNGLQAQASSYQDAIAKLQAQIDGLNAAIAASQARQADLEAKIAANQTKLDNQKKVLADNLKVMYVTGQMSTTEMLASTNDLSTFVDADTYRKAAQQQIQHIVDQINDLQKQLNGQRDQVKQLIAEQQSQKTQMAANQAEQNRLLALNQDQQNAYNGQIAATSGRINQLRQQQATIIASMFRGNGDQLIAGNDGNDTYPAKWKNIGMDSVIDNWGMYNRECVSYTAWKVYASGRNMPYWGGRGNANQWDDNARAAGIPVDTTPRVGDVAVSNAGAYGHVMYVEAVYGDGSIYISQYNANWDGRYSEGRLSAGTVAAKNLQFIHFP